MLNNPVTFFITGNEQKSFTYEGGDTLWHFSPRQSGLSKMMEMNIIFFANDAKHALGVIERIIKFAIGCLNTDYDGMNNLTARQRKLETAHYQTLLDNKNKWIVTLAPLNQVFKVSWASNDNI